MLQKCLTGLQTEGQEPLRSTWAEGQGGATHISLQQRRWGWRPPGHRVVTAETRDTASLTAESKDLFQIHTNILKQDYPTLPLPPGTPVFPAGFWARRGHPLDSHEPAKRGWERHLLPSTHGHTTQKWLISKKQPQHRLIANNTFYENI